MKENANRTVNLAKPLLLLAGRDRRGSAIGDPALLIAWCWLLALVLVLELVLKLLRRRCALHA